MHSAQCVHIAGSVPAPIFSFSVAIFCDGPGTVGDLSQPVLTKTESPKMCSQLGLRDWRVPISPSLVFEQLAHNEVKKRLVDMLRGRSPYIVLVGKVSKAEDDTSA